MAWSSDIICHGKITLLVWMYLCGSIWQQKTKRSGKLPSSIGSLMAHVLVSSELDQATPSSTTLAALTMPLNHQQLSYKNPWDVFIVRLDRTLQAATAHYQYTLRHIVTISARTGDEQHAYNDLDLMVIDLLLLHNLTRLPWIPTTGACYTNLQASWNDHEKEHKNYGQGCLWHSKLRTGMATGIATVIALQSHSDDLGSFLRYWAFGKCWVNNTPVRLRTVKIYGYCAMPTEVFAGATNARVGILVPKPERSELPSKRYRIANTDAIEL
jgi:hypothetical protein